MRGPLVRISPLIEDLVRRTAKKLGMKPSDVRNIAILIGLGVIMWNYNDNRVVEEMEKVIMWNYDDDKIVKETQKTVENLKQ